MPSTPARWQLSVLWLLTLAAFVAGLALLWGYLEREHRRLTPVQGVLVWASEAVSGFWFLWFGVRHVLGREPVATPGRRERWGIGVSLLAGWAIDGAVTWHKFREAAAARAGAVPGVAWVTAGRHRTDSGGVTYYYLHGNFTDPAGADHPIDVIGTLRLVPPAVRAAVEQGQLPTPLPILFDPDYPAHTWLPNEQSDDRIHTLSTFALLFQAFGLFLAVALSIDPGSSSRPSWVVVAETGPFAVSAGILLLSGVIRWLTGQPNF